MGAQGQKAMSKDPVSLASAPVQVLQLLTVALVGKTDGNDHVVVGTVEGLRPDKDGVVDGLELELAHTDLAYIVDPDLVEVRNWRSGERDVLELMRAVKGKQGQRCQSAQKPDDDLVWNLAVLIVPVLEAPHSSSCLIFGAYRNQ
jgi:hypothetical protein